MTTVHNHVAGVPRHVRDSVTTQLPLGVGRRVQEGTRNHRLVTLIAAPVRY